LEEAINSGLVEILHISPSELDIDRHAVKLQEISAKLKATLVVLDSLTALQVSTPDATRFQSHIWAMTDYFKRVGVSVIMTLESRNGLAPTENISIFTDNVILLENVVTDGSLGHSISVPKMRGSDHTRLIKQFIISSEGITVDT
jgi:circadian clock protein KaiC